MSQDKPAWIYVGDAIVQVANICHIQPWGTGCALHMMDGETLGSDQPLESILDAMGLQKLPQGNE